MNSKNYLPIAPVSKSHAGCSGLASLLLAATDDMRGLSCSKSKKPTTMATTNATKSLGSRKLRTWEASFDALVDYASEHGNTAIPVRYKKDKALANWVRYQQRNRDALPPEKRQKLESIGFLFGARNDHQWDTKFLRYQEHIQQHGPDATAQDLGLQQWASTQRALHKKDLLRTDRKEKLDTAGFLWHCNSNNAGACNIETFRRASGLSSNLGQRRDDKWFANFKRLRAFHREHNHFLVPCQYEPDPGLGIWVSNQRSMYNRGILPANRSKLLNDVGFVFQVNAQQARADSYQKQWDQKLRLLRQYKMTHGHANLQPSTVDDKIISSWLTTQQDLGKRGALRADRAERLLALGVSLKEESDKSWAKNFVKLKDLVAAKEKDSFGSSCSILVRKDTSAHDNELGNWLKLQNIMHDHNTLSRKRRYLLERLGVQWNALSVVFAENNGCDDDNEVPQFLPDSMKSTSVDVSEDIIVMKHVIAANVAGSNKRASGSCAASEPSSKKSRRIDNAGLLLEVRDSK